MDARETASFSAYIQTLASERAEYQAHDDEVEDLLCSADTQPDTSESEKAAGVKREAFFTLEVGIYIWESRVCRGEGEAKKLLKRSLVKMFHIRTCMCVCGCFGWMNRKRERERERERERDRACKGSFLKFEKRVMHASARGCRCSNIYEGLFGKSAILAFGRRGSLSGISALC